MLVFLHSTQKFDFSTCPFSNSDLHSSSFVLFYFSFFFFFYSFKSNVLSFNSLSNTLASKDIVLIIKLNSNNNNYNCQQYWAIIPPESSQPSTSTSGSNITGMNFTKKITDCHMVSKLNKCKISSVFFRFLLQFYTHNLFIKLHLLSLIFCRFI